MELFFTFLLLFAGFTLFYISCSTKWLHKKWIKYKIEWNGIECNVTAYHTSVQRWKKIHLLNMHLFLCVCMSTRFFYLSGLLSDRIREKKIIKIQRTGLISFIFRSLSLCVCVCMCVHTNPSEYTRLFFLMLFETNKKQKVKIKRENEQQQQQHNTLSTKMSLACSQKTWFAINWTVCTYI